MIVKESQLIGCESRGAHLGYRFKTLYATFAARFAYDGHDALLAQKKLPLREDPQGIVKTQSLRFGPVVISTA